eukprot:bmy_06752T0
MSGLGGPGPSIPEALSASLFCLRQVVGILPAPGLGCVCPSMDGKLESEHQELELVILPASWMCILVLHKEPHFLLESGPGHRQTAADTGNCREDLRL